jgi:Cohesin domain
MKSSLLLCLLLFAGTTSAFSDTIFISPASQDVYAGQTFAVDVNVGNIPDLYDYQFNLSFDPAVLAAQSITEGALFANTNNSYFLPGSIDNGAGSITFTADTLLGPVPGVTGPGTLAVIDFTAIGNGISSLDFSGLILQDSSLNNLTVTPVSGEVNVAPASEPAPLCLLACGLGLMICSVWRRSKLRDIVAVRSLYKVAGRRC